MVNNHIKALPALLLALLLTNCKETGAPRKYCGFSFEKLKPVSDCTEGLEITTQYAHNRLKSVSYKANNRIVKQDTVLTLNGSDFFLSDSMLQRNRWQRISARILDTSRTFVFNRDNGIYRTSLIESYLNDSTISIQFVWRGNIRPSGFTDGFLDSLLHYHQHEVCFNEHLEVKYQYSNGTLYFKIVEDYGNWRGQDASNDSIVNSFGNIYLDMELIEDRSILTYLKQVQTGYGN